ncbi:MAG TPA: methyltransferase domain-containing protein [Gemmatimonadales bacterium]|nr:methyltransferase domain-containing protein [Gemmatimonadales bacterium]
MAEWFADWFNEDYLALYPHRNEAEAARAVALLTRTLPWTPGWRALDVGCGAGRHARALAAAGVRPVGLDLSAALLKVARGAGVPLVRADMRRLPVRDASVDLAVNLFTSFGYFEQDAEHAAVLRGVARCLRPGGWFALDFLNAEAVARGLVAAESQVLGGQEAAITRRIDPREKRVIKTIRLADGRQFVERVRLFGAGELRAMLQDAGLRVRSAFGDYDGGSVGPDAPRTILISQRAA